MQYRPWRDVRTCLPRSKLAFGVLVLLLGACASWQPVTEVETPAPVAEEPPPPPPPPPVVETPTTEPKPPPKPPVAPPPPPVRPHVSILLSNDTPAYAGVAAELGKLLVLSGDDYSVHNVQSSAGTNEAVFADINEKEKPVVIAIGLRAATLASEFTDVPVVFCQVFNYQSNGLVSDRVRGVSSIPPLDQQLNVWKGLDPELSSVGAIFGAGHESLIEEAERAAAEAGIEFHYRVASSDKESLYLFKRLVPDIDGLWLFPDNRVLSPAVIKETFEYATRHGTQIVVFRPALLKLGAVMSASTSESDVALKVLAVLDRVIDGKTSKVPVLTALSKTDIRVNNEALVRLGLKVPEEYAHLVETRTP